MIVDRFRRCRACNGYHWQSEWPHNHVEPRPTPSLLPRPYVISDTMDGLFHPIDNQTYDSKSAFRRATEAGGGIEMGNEQPVDRRIFDTIKPDDVAEAMHMVEQGYKPAPEQATAEETIDALT